MENVIMITSTLLSCLIVVHILLQFMNDKYEKVFRFKYIYYLLEVIWIIAMLFVNMKGNPSLNLISWIGAIAVVVGIFYREINAKFVKRIIECEVVLLIMSTFEGLGGLILKTILNSVGINIVNDAMKNCLEITFSKLFIIFIYYIVIQRIFIKKVVLNKTVYKIYLIVFVYSFCNMLIMADAFKNGDINIYLTINMGCIVLAVLFLLHFIKVVIDKDSLENEMKILEKQADIQYKYYLEQEKKYNKTFQILHDVNKHIKSIQQLYIHGKVDMANEYTGKITSMLMPLIPVRYTGNTILDIILTDKSNLAKEKEIEFDVKIDNVDLNFIEAIELTTIFGNLLDNAIEACDVLSKNKKITLNIKQIREMVSIQIKNTYDVVKWKNGSLVSVKGKNRGIGLKNIKHQGKKIIASILIIALVVGLCPDMAYANEDNIWYDQGLEEKKEEVIIDDVPEDKEIDIPKGEVLNDEPDSTKKETTILGELEDERTENGKTFLMSDRSKKVVVYSEAVHYKKDGKWKDIDNSLTKEEASGEDDFSGYVNKKNDFKVKIADEIENGSQARIEKGKYSLEFKLNSDKKSKKIKKESKKDSKDKGKNKKLKVDTISETISYEEIATDTDIEYTVTSSGLKENIIVNKKQSNYKYSYDIKVENLKLVLKDNEIKAIDSETEKVIYVIPTPFMYDADGDFSDEVKYSLKEKKGTYILDIKADSKWINDEDRKFPVVIDPIITTETTKAAIDTTFVASETPSTNYNNNLMRLVGRESSAYGKCRTFVSITMPELNVGDIVVSAILNINQYDMDSYTTSTPDLPIEAYMVTESWTPSSMTWNNMPSAQSTPLDYSYICKDDADYHESGTSTSTQLDNNLITKQFDITKAAKAWYDGDITNYGIMLKSGKESGTLVDSGIHGKYWSERYNTVSDAYPLIELEYRNSKGLEDYYSYTDFDCGEAGTAYVNDYTGNLVVTQEGVSTSGEKAPASVYLVNNSADNKKYNYGSKPYVGYGWKLNIQQTIKSSSEYGLTGTALSTYPYVYTDEDGTEHYFMKVTEDGATKYYDEDGLGLELTVSSSKYTITDSQDGKMTFLSNGNLSSIADANGNTITINYDSTNTVIQSVTDGAGKNITITSNGNYLSKITDPAGRSTSYTITDTKLTTITNPDATTVSYTYSTDNIIILTKDVDKYTFTFTLLNAAKGRRISKVNEYGYNSSGTAVLGQSIGFNYSEYNVTKITTSGVDNSYGTSDDIITEYQFDNYARLISTNSKMNGKRFGASTATYTAGEANSSGSNIKKLNRVTKSATLGGNVNNLLLNHNMEKSTDWAFLKTGDCTDYKGYASNYSYIGSKSLRLAATDTTSGNMLRYRQMFANSEVVPGSTYTLSGYIKTTGLSPLNTGTYGAGLVVICYLEDGSSKTFYTDFISSTTNTTINNGWRRESVTFTVPSDTTQTSVNLLLKEANGNAYFDALQLEAGDVANAYNILENGSFEKSNGLYSYTTQNASSSDGIVSTAIDGSKGYKIVGDKDNYKRLIQQVAVSGNEEDTYIVSGWAKASAAPAYITDVSSDVNRRFKISVLITYTDGAEVWKSAAEFNHDVDSWQYSAVVVDLDDGDDSVDRTPAYLSVYPRYEYQVNSAVFDNLSVVRDDVQTYTYDSNGNMTSVVDNATQQSSMSYSNNNLISDTDAKGYAYTYTYDSKHNMTQAKSQYGVMYNYTYNSAGNPTKLVVDNMASSSSEMYLQTDMTYTSDGAYVSSVSDQDGNTVTNTYNTDKGLLTSTTNQKGETTSYTYNANNDLVTKVATTNDAGTEVSNTFGYDKHRLSSITHNGFSYNYGYDEFGNESSVKVGSQSILETDYKNNNGEVSKITYGNGDYNTFTYDKYGNIATVGNNGTTVFKNYADTSGNIVKNEDIANNLLYNYDYDSTSRLIRSTVINTALASNKTRNLYTTEYGYDINNNVAKIINKAGTKTLAHAYTYAKDNLLSVYTLPTSRTVSYAYDSLLRRTSYEISTVDPYKVSYTYHLSGRNEGSDNTYRTTKLAVETIGDKSLHYTYDKVGNITKIQQKTTGSSYTDKATYVYDKLGQLVRENSALENKTRVYNYDNGGNITSIKEYAYTTGTLGTETDTINYAYTDTNWKDLLTSYDGQAITYDAIGNPTSYRGYTMGWSNGRELTLLSGNGINATFTYDASGLRLSKTVGSTTTVYEYVDGKLLYEKKGDMELHYGYDSEGQPRYIQYVKADGSTGSGYMVTNSRGDVVGIVNGNGVMIVNYEYDAWGNVLSVTDQNGAVITSAGHLGNLNSLRYRGYYYDTDLEMYYLQSRYYDPEVRRFINADDVSVLEEDQGSIVEHNMFAYCLNNPVNMLDESGTIAVTTCILIGAGIGAAIGGGVGAYRASKKYKPKDGWKYWKYVVEYGVIGGSVGALVGWGGKRPSC